MNNEWSNLTILKGGRPIKGLWKLEGESLLWVIDEKEYRIREDDLSYGVNKFLKILGNRIYKQECKLKACLTCLNFQMSGMARDMGRGQRGVCNFYNKSVEICFLCENYVKKMDNK